MPVARAPQPSLRRRGLRWAAGLTGVGVIAAATVLTASPATAVPAPVVATFSVTGVSTSNCAVSTGGSDVYVSPGGPLDFKSSVVGITVLGIALSTSGLAGFNGALVIDPGRTSVRNIALSATKDVPLASLPAGDHAFTWTATALNVLGFPLQLSLAAGLPAGASLSYAGVIHVTTAAAKCGIAVQVPRVGATVGPIKINLPPANVNIPVPVIPGLPSLGSLANPGGTTAVGPTGGGVHYTPPPLSVPGRVVPPGSGLSGLSTGGGFGSLFGTFSSALPAAPGAGTTPTDGTVAPAEPSTAAPSQQAIDLSSNRAPAARMPVLLAILAILALSLVTATYARLYLLRREPPAAG